MGEVVYPFHSSLVYCRDPDKAMVPEFARLSLKCGVFYSTELRTRMLTRRKIFFFFLGKYVLCVYCVGTPCVHQSYN